jgi:hypothetical protein
MLLRPMPIFLNILPPILQVKTSSKFWIRFLSMLMVMNLSRCTWVQIPLACICFC